VRKGCGQQAYLSEPGNSSDVYDGDWELDNRCAISDIQSHAHTATCSYSYMLRQLHAYTATLSCSYMLILLNAHAATCSYCYMLMQLHIYTATCLYYYVLIQLHAHAAKCSYSYMLISVRHVQQGSQRWLQCAIFWGCSVTQCSLHPKRSPELIFKTIGRHISNCSICAGQAQGH
jgi:hypothetical protein